ncbi:MAG TPA: septal ring lytic transglycosylase RlpA family protein [Burkholderiales bacterium]|nr:septal ring lytic transglycosylase RlpA family protein [Burkholderiales bacterium]
MAKGGAVRGLALPIRHPPSAIRLVAAAALALALGGCGTPSQRDAGAPPARGGGYYLDDGPGTSPPADIDGIPDAMPRSEPLHRGTGRPYAVMGRSYTPMTALRPYRARGVASWYGRRYHGKPTASGEIYDMYGMTAAHTTLPIPSYARVTNVANGRSVVVRINDRGPFVDNRLIDLSYTAAHKLGVLAGGSALVDVETIIPGAAGAQPRAPVVSAGTPEEPAIPATMIAPHDPASAPPPRVAGTAEADGHYLQLGAFGSRENAENFLARVKAQADWLAALLHITERERLFRVHAGPYASQAEARQTAERIGQALGERPMLLTR